MFLLDMAMGKYYDAQTWGGSYPKQALKALGLELAEH